MLEASYKVKIGEAFYERDSVVFDQIEYSWPVTSGLMFVAAQNRGQLNVLDFGGSLGSNFFQNRKFLKTLTHVCWNIVEQPHFVNSGRKHFQDKQLRFYYSVDECLNDNKPNVVLLSSVLQYLPNPGDIIEILKRINADLLIIDSTIINYTDTNKIFIQHVPPSIYKASYPCYSFSESWLVESFKNKYLLMEDFMSIEFSALNKINSTYKGYIFERSQ